MGNGCNYYEKTQRRKYLVFDKLKVLFSWILRVEGMGSQGFLSIIIICKLQVLIYMQHANAAFSNVIQKKI